MILFIWLPLLQRVRQTTKPLPIQQIVDFYQVMIPTRTEFDHLCWKSEYENI